MKEKILVFFFLEIMLISMVAAQNVSLDVRIDKDVYSAGENLSYNVILLQNGNPISQPVNVKISDVTDQNSFSQTVNSNENQFLLIGKDFASGYWSIEANYNGQDVKRFFTIGAREEAQFILMGDTLIINNTGNVPYTKTVQILIGDQVFTQKHNIEVGQSKEIKLVAPNGNYDIKVSDGDQSISSSNVHLTTTGNVIGAVDQELVKNQPVLGGVRDPNQTGFFGSSNSIIAVVFIGAVFLLFVLFLAERFVAKRRGFR